MRSRQIKPSFWSDSHISDLAVPTRLFYIGTWMLADDAGFIRWDTREVAAALYGYEPVRHREARVTRMLAELVAAGRLVDHGCGHVEVPTLTAHQHLSGLTKQVKTAYNEHRSQCFPQSPAVPRDVPQVPAPVRLGIRLGSVRLDSADAKEETKGGLRAKLGEFSDVVKGVS